MNFLRGSKDAPQINPIQAAGSKVKWAQKKYRSGKSEYKPPAGLGQVVTNRIRAGNLAARKAYSPLNRLIGGFKKGGKVKKTGAYKLHKGERVLNKKQSKKFNAGAFESARRKHFGMGKKQ